MCLGGISVGARTLQCHPGMTSIPTQHLPATPHITQSLEQFAVELATSHRVLPGRHRGRPIRGQLRANRRALQRACRGIASDGDEEQSVSPAAEWLIDNFPIMDEQIRQVERDLGPGFYAALPKLASGTLAGYPRIFALACAYIEHSASRFESATLSRFVIAYQTTAPLTLGELWALDLSLRIVLVGRLRHLADEVLERRARRAEADRLATLLLRPGRTWWTGWRLWRLAGRQLSVAFSARLIQRMHDLDPDTTPGLVWLHSQLTGDQPDAASAVRLEHIQQVGILASVRDNIGSLRALTMVEWRDFVESVSQVETTLRDGRPPHEMDFATRDRYRHAVEQLAKGSGQSELAVAVAAVRRAQSAGPGSTLHGETGFWLISAGRSDLERELGYRAPWRTRLLDALPMGMTSRYLTGIHLGTLLLLGSVLWVAGIMGAGLPEQLILGVLALLPASELSITLLNSAVTRSAFPRPLPKLELEEGVPEELRTLIAVPCMLTDAREVSALVERLEVHYLANADEQLVFALVTDWADAAEELVSGDDVLLEQAREGIDDLNAVHSGSGLQRFHLFHRGRQWNERQNCWMGWERKRGKLHELNRLLRGATDTSFLEHGPTPAELSALNIRYVICLDADTRLPQGAARRLVGTIAHPLNQPMNDPASGRVVRGHGILQPRVTPSLPEAGPGTLTQRIFASSAGMDPYAFTVSEVYQDLFGEGSYTGKGIYDVDAFELALSGRVPENSMLSHDLFEGLHAGAGLVSDIEVFESHPSQYPVAAARQHRWVRGDWQLLRWIVSPGPISGIGRWKMVDNLRRSLVPLTALGTLLAGWLLPDGRAALWTGFVLLTLVTPVLMPVVLDGMPRPGFSKRAYVRQKARDIGLALARAGLAVSLLPGEAYRMTDAISRTLVRLATGRGPMLEWLTAAAAIQTRKLRHRDDRALTVTMLLAATTLLLVGFVEIHALPLVAPFVLLWGASPLVIWVISAPVSVAADRRLDLERSSLLRMTARRTWRYFETFVTAEHHHLPPDNYQEDPSGVVAHRTSPTNIGLYLLSTVCAHDMGWLGIGKLADRLTATLSTLERMERHRGHFYNWYDTRSLVPLSPHYVSTVDSGNLVAHLVTLQQACLELSEQPVSRRRCLAGVMDVVAIARDAIMLAVDDRRDGVVQTRHLEETLSELANALHIAPPDAPDWKGLLARAELLMDTAQALADDRGGTAFEESLTWVRAIRTTLAEHSLGNQDVSGVLARLAERAGNLATNAEWTFLFDPSRKLFRTGYDVSAGRLDVYAYDQLASECRVASFMAIARRDVPVSHWFRLGRRITVVGSGSALLSWSGSMFEYLMPALIMAEPHASLLASTGRSVVAYQQCQGRRNGFPWGVSECAYNGRDLDRTYQYGPFGLAGLGIKPGLAEDLVLAPYATALAAMVSPVDAADNLVALSRIGASGRYGFYESVDCTAARLPDGQRWAVVKAYFAHHQGMSIVALCNVLDDFAMRRRFHASPMVQANELLLHERSPRDVVVVRPLLRHGYDALHVRNPVLPVLREFRSPHQVLPATQQLSNGSYSVTITAAGGGQSVWQDLAVTRWTEDETVDSCGTFVFVRDVHSGEIWSASHQPSGVEADEYMASFHEHRVEIRRRDGNMVTELDVVVALDADAELRQVRLTNQGNRARTLDVTSYAEVVIAPQAADTAHRAFSNLFVETSFDASSGALFAKRRARSPGERSVWAAHVSSVSGAASTGVQFETDRARFLGRGRLVRNAAVVQDSRALSNTVGAVLDPIFSLRRRIVVEPGETVKVLFSTLVDTDLQRLRTQCNAHSEPGLFDRTVAQAWSHAQVQLRHLGIDMESAHLFQRLASRVLYTDPGMRAPADVLMRNRLGQAGLWKFSISGDRAILVGRIQAGEGHELVRQLVRAHCYWRAKGIVIDLIILDEQDHSYGEELHAELERLVRASHVGGFRNGVHIVRADQLSPEDHDLILTAARVVVQSRDGTLEDQILRRLRQNSVLAPPQPERAFAKALPEQARLHPELEFFNGIGGFSSNGRDYVTVLGSGQWTPLPWVNVIANPGFGFVVSEAGSGFTWAENSRENQLTPWSNDPSGDPPGEVLYIRDDESGALFTATPLPIREDSRYLICHGQGFTSFVHDSHELAAELVQFVATDDPVKFSRLRLRNTSSRERRISVAAYVEWVLGPVRAVATPFVVTSMDSATGAMFARNRWKAEFADRVAFLDIGGGQQVECGDRTHWIGRNGSLGAPSGLSRDRNPAGAVGPGLDPCGMLMKTFILKPGEMVSMVVLLGQAANEDEARRLVARARASRPDDVLRRSVELWDELLGVVQVRTPDRAMDLMLNRWLLYQTVSCRLWARAGFYQAGGAYGFRDQLQDGMALVISRPDLVREHLLRAAARQFPQGDVQHWWHPPTGKGVRTRFSDDRIWLAYAAAHYVEVSGDAAVLEEVMPFIDAATLQPGQEDAYQEPVVSMESGTLYEHIARALDISLAVGRHGLPLIGGGDWNDGMNHVGAKGEGESVWLAWFLIATLDSWIEVARKRGDTDREQIWRAHVAQLRSAVEEHAWDGNWYRRAFDDAGDPIGSADNLECRIDSIAQSWSVLSRGDRPDRARMAMASVSEHLVRRADALILLLTPPFDKGPQDPGYIKGYVPGVRENGGQYTHAAAWVVMAWAALGDGNRAFELFSMLNPIHHASTRAGVQRYKVEPYVVAADVYSEGAHVGRGGWTWYTGSAAWMYRAGLESILGIQVRGERLHLAPCIPDSWPGYEVTLKRGRSMYTVAVTNPEGVQTGIVALTLDGVVLNPVAGDVPWVDDGKAHRVQVTMG